MKSNLLSRARHALGLEPIDGDVHSIDIVEDIDELAIAAARRPSLKLIDDDLVELSPGQIAAIRTRELVDSLRASGTTFDDIGAGDIETNIAIAARENSMTDERQSSVSDTLSDQMKIYADQVNGKIATIQGEQKIADEAHRDALAALNREIEERTAAHRELTEGNDARIEDHRRALAGVAALQQTLHPVAEQPKGRAKIAAVPPSPPVSANE